MRGLLCHQLLLGDVPVLRETTLVAIALQVEMIGVFGNSPVCGTQSVVAITVRPASMEQELRRTIALI